MKFILKNQFGNVMSDVDTRSDSTRKGYHEGQASYGANLNFPIFDIMGAVNDKLSVKPQTSTLTLPNGSTMNLGLQTGEPIILPGMMKNPKMITEPAKVLRAAESSFVDLRTPTVPKGFIKGNELTPDLRHPIVEEGLTGRSARLANRKWLENSNPITDEGSLQAAKDWVAEQKSLVRGKGRPKGSTNSGKDVIKNFKKERQAATENKEIIANTKQAERITETKTAKVTQSERYKDRREYSKALRTKDKNARAMETGKATIRNSGQSGIHNRQDAYDWEVMKKYKEYNRPMVKIESSLAKHAKGTPEYKQAMQRKKDLIARYRREKRFALGGKIMGMNHIGL